MTQTPDRDPLDYPGMYRPPAPPQGYYLPPPAPVQPTTTGLGITSMILGLLGWIPFLPGLCVLAVIFGGIGLNQVNRGKRTGQGYPIAGLCLGIVETVIWFLVLVAASAPTAGYR